MLLAVLASGEDWGAKAQVDAVAAKNQLANTEAHKLGTRKVATTLKIANREGASRWVGNDGDEGITGGGVSGGGSANPTPQSIGPAIGMLPGQRKPRSKMAANPLDPTRPPQEIDAEKETQEAQHSAGSPPSAQDLASMTAASARRSGASDNGD